MPVHKIKLYYSVVGADQFHQWLAEWHTSVNTDTADLIANEVPDATVSQPGVSSDYYSVTFSYPPPNAPTEILKQPYQKLVECCKWSKVGYHQCGDMPGGTTDTDCHYTQNKIYADGDVPEHIPGFN
jgi:hypothetical protein